LQQCLGIEKKHNTVDHWHAMISSVAIIRKGKPEDLCVFAWDYDLRRGISSVIMWTTTQQTQEHTQYFGGIAAS